MYSSNLICVLRSLSSSFISIYLFFFNLKLKKKLRVFITNQFYPGKIDADNEEDSVPQWELKIEGRLLDDVKLKQQSKNLILITPL